MKNLTRCWGWELGADDYITKPFSVREVLARIRAVFRRIQQSAQAKRKGQRRYSQEISEIDTEKYEVGEEQNG